MTIKLHVGDCREVMPKLDPVDAIVTDPPYGLEFMGKGWDRGVPGVEFWREALRVLRPGGHLLAFGGTRTFHRLTCAVEDAGFEIRDCLSWLYGQGFPKSLDVSKAIDKEAAAEPAAREWSGWGTALKPAWEPIILARKPLDGTVASNVQKHGTGALNIDASRVGIAEGDRCVGGARSANGRGEVVNYGGGGYDGEQKENVVGRFPSNVLLDEEAAAMLDEQSGLSTSPTGTVTQGVNRTGSGYRVASSRREGAGIGYGDSGGASRFFYVTKSSTAERGDGNDHPTVKPVDLMSYLVRLVTPPGGLVLDPFLGSGTTGIAAARLGFNFVGIESDRQYAELARRRIESDAPLFNRVEMKW